MKAETRKVRLTNTAIKALEPAAKVYDVNDADTPGLLVRVQPSGVKTYFLRYRASGKQRYFRIGNPAQVQVAEARLAAKKHLADVVHGIDPQLEKQRPKDLTLEQFLEVYKGEASLKWHLEAEARVRRCFKDLLSLPLAEITDKPVKQYRNRRQNAKVSGGTINRDIAALRGVLTLAVERGHLESNPLVSKGMKNLKEDSGKVPRYLKPEELKRLHDRLDAREEEMRAARDSHNEWREERGYEPVPSLRGLAFTDHMRPLILLALNTGLRRGELFGLEWNDCTLDGSAPSLVVHGHGAKSGRTRHVPLNQSALSTLTDWKAQGTGEGLVFPSPETGGKFDNVNSAWRKIAKDAGLTGVKFHDLRHHFASMLVQAGVDLNVVRELLGHADLKLTLRYAHLAPGNKATAVALLDSAVENVVLAEESSRSEQVSTQLHA